MKLSLISMFLITSLGASELCRDEVSSNLEQVEPIKTVVQDCRNNSIDFIPKSEWASLKEEIYANELLTDKEPKGDCFKRASLIAFYLDSKGYKSEKIMFAPSSQIASFKEHEDGWEALYYSNHIANVVSIQENGRIKKYVLDPMFEKELVPIAEYVESSSSFSTDLLNYELLPMNYEYNNESQLPRPNFKAPCSFSKVLLETYRNEISKVGRYSDTVRVRFKTKEMAKYSYQLMYGLINNDFKSWYKQNRSKKDELIRVFDNYKGLSKYEDFIKHGIEMLDSIE